MNSNRTTTQKTTSGRTPSRSLPAVGIALCMIGLTGCGGSRDSDHFEVMLQGRRLPDAILTDLSGKQVALSDFLGRPVLIAFWASTCGYCGAEAPYLTWLSQRYRDQGLVVLGVNARGESRESVARFVAKYNVGYPVLLGGTELIRSLRVSGIPTVLYVDRRGMITDADVGMRGALALDRKTKRLLAAVAQQQ